MGSPFLTPSRGAEASNLWSRSYSFSFKIIVLSQYFKNKEKPSYQQLRAPAPLRDVFFEQIPNQKKNINKLS
jgi:hypothetical protein